MHQIVLLTALTAASGLFGGGRHGSTGRWGHSYTAAPCSGQAPCNVAQYPAAYAPAPIPVAPVPRAAYYQSNYYAPAAAPCPTGNCPRR